MRRLSVIFDGAIEVPGNTQRPRLWALFHAVWPHCMPLNLASNTTSRALHAPLVVRKRQRIEFRTRLTPEGEMLVKNCDKSLIVRWRDQMSHFVH